jgi:hypothetical protein
MKKKEMIEIARNCLEAIEAGGGMRTSTIMLIEDNLKLMLGEE